MRTSAITASWVVLLLAAPAVAIDVPALIAAAPGPQAFPGVDAVILYREVDCALDGQGRLTRREHTVTRLQSQWAMRNLSDARVDWDSDRQDLTIHTCRTFMADGTEIGSPANAYNEVTPGDLSGAVPFLGIREMVISHVGTEVNCVLDLDYEIADRLPPAIPASGEVFLQDRWPVLAVEVRISPANTAAALVNPGESGVQTSASSDATIWTARDLPALPLDGAGAHRGDFAPQIVFSAAGDLTALVAALRAASEAATAELGPQLQAWLDSGDDLTREDTVRRIADLASEGVRSVRLPTGAWSRAPRPIAEVYASAVATPWERALLTMALLKATGLTPELGFFTRWSDPARDVAAAGHFEQLRVVAPLAGQNWWFDGERKEPWSGGCDLAGHTGLFLESGGGHRTWQVPADAGRCRLAVKVTPSKDGKNLEAEADLELTGVLRAGRGDAAALATALAKRLVPAGEVTETRVRLDAPEALGLRVKARGPALAPDADGLVIWAPPFPRDALLAHLPAGFHAEQPARLAPLFVDAGLTEEVTITVELPDSLGLDVVPAATERSCALGTYRLTVEREERRLVLRRTLELRPGRCDPADYPALRAMLADALRQDAAPLILLTDVGP